MAEKCCCNDLFKELFEGEDKMTTREDKRMVKLERKNQNFPFWAYVEKNQHIHFLVHGRSS